MDLIVSSDATVSISVGPFEGLGVFVVDFDIASDFAGEVGFRSKDATARLARHRSLISACRGASEASVYLFWSEPAGRSVFGSRSESPTAA
jgi:hypothetical protein